MKRRDFLHGAAGLALAGELDRTKAATPPAESIWGRTVGAQPFDSESFREIAIPDWLRETAGVGYTLSGQSEEARAAAAAAGVTISEMGFVNPFFANYDSQLIRRRDPSLPADYISREIASYRRHGVRILAVYPPTLQGEVYEPHPESRHIATDTREIPQVDLKKQPFGGMLCLLGPYGDFFIEVLAEIVTRHPEVDAFSFDGLHYAGVCYCAACRDNHRRDAGREIPPADIENADFRRYQHWADRRMEDVIRRAQKRLKAIKPTVALVTWSTNAGRWGHFLDVPRNMPARMNLLLDAPDMEFWLDETNRGASIVPAFGSAFMWAVTNHRVAFAEPYLMSRGNPYGKDSFPGHEIERRMLLALTHGPFPSLAVGQPRHLQEAAYRGIREVKRRAPFLFRRQPYRWAALAMSDNTRCFYGRRDVEQRYLSHVLGFFRAAVETHLPCTVVNDWNLLPGGPGSGTPADSPPTADLNGYRVLILPNMAALDDAQAAAVRRFVEAGGGLVASLDTGLTDEFGNPRPSPALADLFAIEHGGPAIAAQPDRALDVNFARTLPPDYWEKRRGVWNFLAVPGSMLDTPALTALLGQESVTFKGPAIRIRPTAPDVTTVAHLLPREGNAPPIPAIVTRQVGAGRVVFLAAGLDAANYLVPYPYHRVILRQCIDWAAREAPPVEVTAPLCVHATFSRHPRPNRLTIQLFNDVNTTAFHGLPSDDVPLREETLPIHGITVLFRQDRPTRVHLQPDGLALPLETTPDGTRVTLPRLDVHAIVVAHCD